MPQPYKLVSRGADLLNTSPLGKYAEIVTAVIAFMVVASAIFAHLLAGILKTTFDTAFLDNLALIAAGVLFGARAVSNGAKEAVREPIGELARDVAALHKRFDDSALPPARDGEGKEIPS